MGAVRQADTGQERRPVAADRPGDVDPHSRMPSRLVSRTIWRCHHVVLSLRERTSARGARITMPDEAPMCESSATAAASCDWMALTNRAQMRSPSNPPAGSSHRRPADESGSRHGESHAAYRFGRFASKPWITPTSPGNFGPGAGHGQSSARHGCLTASRSLACVRPFRWRA